MLCGISSIFSEAFITISRDYFTNVINMSDTDADSVWNDPYLMENPLSIIRSRRFSPGTRPYTHMYMVVYVVRIQIRSYVLYMRVVTSQWSVQGDRLQTDPYSGFTYFNFSKHVLYCPFRYSSWQGDNLMRINYKDGYVETGSYTFYRNNM